MLQHPSNFLLLILIGIFSPCIAAIAQVDQTTVLDAVDTRSCFFVGEKAKFAYTYLGDEKEGAQPIVWDVQWSLMAENRTLQTGTDKAIALEGSNPLQYVVEIPTPNLRDGVSFPIQLSMTWRGAAQKHVTTRVIHLFAKDAFKDHQSLLTRAEITLFDPERRTAERLEQQKIPFSQINNLSGVDRVSSGFLIVGEGVSFQEQRLLGESLVQAAQRGVSVLCVAPTEGNFPGPAIEEDNAARPQRLLLEREDFVRRYDKRFDILRCVTQLELSTDGEDLLKITKNQNQWAWLDMRFPVGKPNRLPGRLMFCGFGLVSQWDEGPTPRYLFLKLIEEFVQQDGER